MPIERDAFYSMLGIARRAGVLTLGSDGVHAAIAAKEAGMVLLDSGASPATKKKYQDACGHAGVKLGMLPEGMLLEATSKPGMAMAVIKGGLAQQITGLLDAANPIQSANNCGGASVE